jgi:hypothetical protein
MSSQQVLLALFGVGLVIVAGYFGWRQYRQLQWLRAQTNLSLEDRIYFRRQIVRRLMGCLVLLVLAVQIAGLFYWDILGQLDRLSAIGDEARAKDVKLGPEDMKPEQREFLNFALTYLLVMALSILLLMLVAMIDVMAIRRYGMRHRRRIREDRRAMLERQLPNLRWNRSNGQD